MSKRRGLSPERQALRDALRELEDKALRGRDRTEAISEANRRLQQDGLSPPAITTVGGWFENGSRARDFRFLWALVRVLLEWSGQPPADTLSGHQRAEAAGQWAATKKYWKTLYEQVKASQPSGAQPAEDNSVPLARRLNSYLHAAVRAAREHPYPGISGDRQLALADVYVHQQAYLCQASGSEDTTNDDATPVESAADSSVPAEAVFCTDSSICLLSAGPGAGKSTLLRNQLADSAHRLLNNRTGKTVPVMVRATSLTSTDPLPTALAKDTTSSLKQFGLLEELRTDFFRHPPRAGARWLVLVDGFDELPDADTRSAVLQMLTNTVQVESGLYRFIVTTRPLPQEELRSLGSHVPHFRLQPFSHDDLRAYATRQFRSLDNPGERTEAFMTGLKRGDLTSFACTPLMASMLCQLYAADPARPLPEGRTGVYQAFVELIYEQNTHKSIKTTHDQAIRRFKDCHQIPKHNQAAERAAQQVRDHLPELIGRLACKKIFSTTVTAVEVLASLNLNRPEKVKEPLWNAFLGDLLRPTGLLIQHADNFDFLHQTLLEYCAVQHLTRNEQMRTLMLRNLIDFSSCRAIRLTHIPPAIYKPSPLGFLLDGLLAPRDRVTDATVRFLEKLARSDDGVSLLATQVHLRTMLPSDFVAAHLTRMSGDEVRGWSLESVKAATALMHVDGHREAGATLLARQANDPRLDFSVRYEAAETLKSAAGYRDVGAALLTRVTMDHPFLRRGFRVRAAELLFEESQKAGTPSLMRLANDLTVDDSERGRAAAIVFYADRAAGAPLLTRLANDPTLHSPERVRAAAALASRFRAPSRLGGLRDVADLES
ncbi:hypothetical protein QCN29_35965 [Streptomyces sp. HNM0663]|uniref:NACHT domain-containing protein n=1 Tax=Streptomyces chengmaiensis TaxID=3040919 RepID=A0ABT6HZA0_9ACTN|nr:NACHT domain-containing protein [Streptomyces chengmaiensis]MDH2394046.1 hypothetical protein [Streptomyces chengmaiensis]